MPEEPAEYPAVESSDYYIDPRGFQHCAACETILGSLNDFGDVPTTFVKHYCNPADVYRTCMSYRKMLERVCDDASCGAEYSGYDVSKDVIDDAKNLLGRK